MNTVTKYFNLTHFTKILLDISFAAGAVLWAALPFAIRYYSRFNTYFERFWWQLWILFAVTGIFALLIVSELRRMFRTVLDDNCFVASNVTSLKRMGIYALCISAVCCLRLFLYITPAVIVVILTFFIAGLFSRVLAQVFEKAVNYKLENDLTI